MNLRPRKREEPEIGVIPLIDVMLMLLIFFMLTTSFLTESEIKVKLPEASPQPIPAEAQRVEVVIDAAGNYAVNDRPLADHNPRTLQSALIAAAGNQRGQAFVIRADGRTPHQAVVTAMDAASQLGFNHLTIATVPAAQP